MFIAITQYPDPLSIVTEYCPIGSLKDFLVKSKDKMCNSTLAKIIIGIGAGMLHLEYEGVVHRDLAARNVLLDENLQPKISDFGFSRILQNSTWGKAIDARGPLRWMAPECLLEGCYSSKSDAWSFAIVLYEIFFGGVPYPNLSPANAAALVAKNELKPYIPTGIPIITDLMNRCLKFDPKDRPSFSMICQTLQHLSPKAIPKLFLADPSVAHSRGLTTL